MNTLVFFSLFILVFALLNTYIDRRMIRFLGVPERVRRYMRMALVLLFAAQIAYALSFRLDILPSEAYYLLSLAIALSFMLFVTALAYDLTHLVIRKTPLIMRRADTLKILLDALVLVLFAAYVGSGIVGGQRAPEIKEVTVELARLTAPEMTVVQLSDVHVGNTIRREFVVEMVERVNALHPDMILITGDLVDRDVAKAADDLEPLRNLKSPLGTFFVHGNHEYFHNYVAIAEHLKTLGIRVLEDESVRIGEGMHAFDLVGTLDKVGERMGFGEANLSKAFAQADPNTLTIVMSHQPVMVEQMDEYAPDLVLSGHTHGGQIFPFSYLVKLAQPYLAGLYRHNAHTQIYVSRGTGFWGPPIRVFAPSEITLLHLKPKETRP